MYTSSICIMHVNLKFTCFISTARPWVDCLDGFRGIFEGTSRRDFFIFTSASPAVFLGYGHMDLAVAA